MSFILRFLNHDMTLSLFSCHNQTIHYLNILIQKQFIAFASNCQRLSQIFLQNVKNYFGECDGHSTNMINILNII